MSDYEGELDETARLIFMESPGCSLTEFVNAMRREMGAGLTLVQIGTLWHSYRGYDGRTLPTHDVLTGRRIVR